jgi:hypothetical protein
VRGNTERENRRLARRIKDAKLTTRASLDNFLCDPERGIDEANLRQLAGCGWVKSKHNVVIVGKTVLARATWAQRSRTLRAAWVTARSSTAHPDYSANSHWHVQRVKRVMASQSGALRSPGTR